MIRIQQTEATEVKVGRIPEHTMRLEDIPGSEFEKRALEVALSGGHSIALLYNNGSQAPDVVKVAKRIAKENGLPFHGLAYPWCSCGNYGSHKEECRCSAKSIEKHLVKLVKRVDDFDIWIGASTPVSRDYRTKGEPETDFLKRILNAREIPGPKDDLDISCREMIEAYVKNVSERLDISRATRLARTIARLDGQDKILVQHIAEALQYQPHLLGGFRDFLKPIAVEERT